MVQTVKTELTFGVFQSRFDSSVGRKVRKSVDVADAAESAMNGSLNYEGTLERINERLDNHARFVGALVDKLVEGGALDKAALEHLLGFDYTLVVLDV